MTCEEGGVREAVSLIEREKNSDVIELDYEVKLKEYLQYENDLAKYKKEGYKIVESNIYHKPVSTSPVKTVLTRQSVSITPVSISGAYPIVPSSSSMSVSVLTI
jgi:hypothetical protein